MKINGQQSYSAFKLLTKLAFRRRYSLSDFRTISLRFNQLQPDLINQEKYREMFNLLPEENLPVTYLFNVSYRHLGQLLSKSRIPSKLIGLIHLSSHYIQLQEHNWQKSFDLKVTIESYQTSSKGISYLLVTKCFQDGQLTLINENTVLDKNPNYKSGKKQRERSKPLQQNYQLIAQQELTISQARQYAHLSKDYNPIHLYHSFAKLLGMKRALMHGMHNAHWIASQLSQQITDATQINFEFNRPCYLPSQINLFDIKNSAYGLFSDDMSERYVQVVIKS